MVKECWQA